MLWVVTVAWLYIKPSRDVSSKEPTGDPVDSDPDVFTAKAALSEPMVWSQRDFAIPVKLWPFSPILPVLEKYIWTNFLEKMSNHKKRWNFLVLHSTQNNWFIWKDVKNIFFSRCGLSSTYPLVPLALLQYDTKPTRQYDSIMLIHDSLDTGVFSQMLHSSTIIEI